MRRRVSSFPPIQTRKTITSARNVPSRRGCFQLPSRLRTKSTASITIWTTNAAMPPRDPERKMLAAISAAIPATRILRLPSVKRVAANTSGKASASPLDPHSDCDLRRGHRSSPPAPRPRSSRVSVGRQTLQHGNKPTSAPYPVNSLASSSTGGATQRLSGHKHEHAVGGVEQ